jgi:AraC-like DNA-binding protein
MQMGTYTSDFARSRPAEPLRAYISHYVGFRAHGLQPSVHSGMPSRHLCLAISLADPIQIVRAPGAPSPIANTAFIGGFSIGPTTVAYGTQRDGLFVHLKPNGVFALFGIRALELSSRPVDLSLILGSKFPSFIDPLVVVSGWSERFAILDQFFLETFKPVDTCPELAWAWNRLIEARGYMPIDQLAAAVGWSRQHLAKRFRHEFGTSPKTAARIFRFENAVRLLKTEQMGLAEVAAECGFHDQAHMTLEWNAMAGCSPKNWIVRELPIFQYTDPLGVDD